jgi:hypothetical protein
MKVPAVTGAPVPTMEAELSASLIAVMPESTILLVVTALAPMAASRTLPAP